MSKYKLQNGFTKAKMIKVLKARVHGGEEISFSYRNSACVYKDRLGNRCAVGAFIPDRHEGLKYNGSVFFLIDHHPDLKKKMPLTIEGMIVLQNYHDSHVSGSLHAGKDVLKGLIQWVKKNVA